MKTEPTFLGALGAAILYTVLYLPIELFLGSWLILGALVSLDIGPVFSVIMLVLIGSIFAGTVRAFTSLRRQTHLRGIINDLMKQNGELLLVPNPWQAQQRLMMISDQEMPPRPQITKMSILYGALILEESGETMVALGNAMEEASHGRNTNLYNMADSYARMGRTLQDYAKATRKQLEGLGPREIKDAMMSQAVAKELLDGFTDIHVVTCGASLACGMPGAAAYADTVGSNLSKANPDTGRIDKTADGKWIKGRNYREPNLDALLAPHYPT